MRSVFTVTSMLACIAILGACGPGTEGGADSASGTEAAEETQMSAVELARDVSCWLRDTTMEDAMARPSPLGETEFTLEGHVGIFCYGRPYARDRVVEGGLIPFGEPWRLGANEASAIHLPFPARVGGIELQPGSYSIYAVAGEFEWEFFLNSDAERWGIPINDGVRAADIGSFTGLPRTMNEPVEQFTVLWHTHGTHEGHLVLEWGGTRVEFEVSLLDHVH